MITIIIGLFFSVLGVSLISFGIREEILKGNKEESKIKKGIFLTLGTVLGVFSGTPDKVSTTVVFCFVSIVIGFLFVISY